MLPGKPANVEQASLGRLELGRIEGQRIGCADDLVLRLARLDQRPVERRQRLREQRMIRRTTLDLASGQAQLRERAFRSAE